MPRKSNTEVESPIANLTFKKSWSGREDDDSSITNSAIFQAKSIESFDVIYDYDSFCTDIKSTSNKSKDLNVQLTFDSAVKLPPTQEESGVTTPLSSNNTSLKRKNDIKLKNVVSTSSSPFIIDEYNKSSSAYMMSGGQQHLHQQHQQHRGSTSSISSKKKGLTLLSPLSPPSQKNYKSSSIVSGGNATNSVVSEEDERYTKSRSFLDHGKKVSIKSPRHMVKGDLELYLDSQKQHLQNGKKILTIDTNPNTEDDALTTTTFSQFTTPRSTLEDVEEDAELNITTVTHPQSRVAESNTPEAAAQVSPSPTTVSKNSHKNLLNKQITYKRAQPNHNSVVFSEKVLQDDSFESIISSVLPSLCQLDSRNQATILNVILEEIANDKFHDEPPIPRSSTTEPNQESYFDYAQRMRKQRYVNSNYTYSWGLLGIYEYLDDVYSDLKWSFAQANDVIPSSSNEARHTTAPLPFLLQDSSTKNNHRPFIICTLLIIHTATLIASYALNNWNIELIEINPLLGPSSTTLLDMGAKQTALIVYVGEYYRLMTCIFLNAGMIQYAFNLMTLAYVGSALERCFGSIVVFFLYVGTGIGGAILSSMLLVVDYVSVCANGGICGLLGCAICTVAFYGSYLFSNEPSCLMNKSMFWKHVRVTTALIILWLIQICLGVAPFLDNVTNLISTLYGVIFGLSMCFKTKCNLKLPKKRVNSRVLTKKLKFRYYCDVFWHFVRIYAWIIFGIVGIVLTGCFLETVVVKNVDTTEDAALLSLSSIMNNYFGCISLPPWKEFNEKWWYCDDCAANAIAYPHEMNLTLGLYTHVTLKCPSSNEMIEVNITSDEIEDIEELEVLVPFYCREYCTNLYANHTTHKF